MANANIVPYATRQDPAAYCGMIPFQTIQEAIYRAPRNATVTIMPGIYTELLTINKSLTLIGEAPETTLLAPASMENSDAIKITAEGVTIANLSLCNIAPGLYTRGITIKGEWATITHCFIHDTPIGIALWSSHATITHCIFRNCTDEGIALLGSNASACNHNHITACLFSKNGDGIELQQSSENLFSACSFHDNIHAGIDMIKSTNTKNTVIGCGFSSNQCFGMYCAGSSQLQITHCIFSQDSIMLINVKGAVISTSNVTGIHLFHNTTLIIDQCNPIDESSFSTQESQYLLLNPSSQTAKSNNHSLHGVSLALTSRLQILQFIASHLGQYHVLS